MKISSFTLDEILKLFGYQIHICEILPTYTFNPLFYKIKGNLHPNIAIKLLNDYIPIENKFEYKQDKRIKRWKYTSKYDI